MAEIIPGIPVLAIILPHTPPLTLAEVRSPFLPDLVIARLLQAELFLSAIHRLISNQILSFYPEFSVNKVYPNVSSLPQTALVGSRGNAISLSLQMGFSCRDRDYAFLSSLHSGPLEGFWLFGSLTLSLTNSTSSR